MYTLVVTICFIYWTQRNHGLCSEGVYLELNTFLDPESNPRPFNLEPTALTVIPPCSGEIHIYAMKMSIITI